jgi:hypothetical protein
MPTHVDVEIPNPTTLPRTTAPVTPRTVSPIREQKALSLDDHALPARQASRKVRLSFSCLWPHPSIVVAAILGVGCVAADPSQVDATRGIQRLLPRELLGEVARARESTSEEEAHLRVFMCKTYAHASTAVGLARALSVTKFVKRLCQLRADVPRGEFFSWADRLLVLLQSTYEMLVDTNFANLLDALLKLDRRMLRRQAIAVTRDS